jgi:hypothetical protein
VVTSNFYAEFGRASGGIVNAATNAGGNAFRDTLNEFNRVSALATTGFDAKGNQINGGGKRSPRAIHAAHTGRPLALLDCTNGQSTTNCLRVVQTGAQPRSGSGSPAPDPSTPGQFRYLETTGLSAGVFAANQTSISSSPVRKGWAGPLDDRHIQLALKFAF